MDIREKIWRRNLNGYKFKERVYETNATKYDIFMQKASKVKLREY